MAEQRREIVILGAGLAGLAAAHQLRDRDVLVLERRDRVGGRTFSERNGSYWINQGAQYVWDERTLELCSRLGLDVISADGARTALFIRDRLTVAPNPYALLLMLPLSPTEKADLALTILRLRWRSARADGLEPELDARSLADLYGRVKPVTEEVLEMVTESGTGVSAREVSGAIGLGYAIHLFGGDVNDTLKAVEGGTQRIAERIAEQFEPERLALGTTVESVVDLGDAVEVTYQGENGRETVKAEACIAALPADALLEVVTGLPDAKREALKRMTPYASIVSVGWFTDERGPAAWDRLLAVPAVGLSFELFSNNGFFARAREVNGRAPGGSFVTLATAARAEALWSLDDQAIVSRHARDLGRMFPEAREVFLRARTRVTRWRGLPRFRVGWLAVQQTLRAPTGRIFYCGDYTSQPGTPGAVKSGLRVAESVREALA